MRRKVIISLPVLLHHHNDPNFRSEAHHKSQMMMFLNGIISARSIFIVSPSALFTSMVHSTNVMKFEMEFNVTGSWWVFVIFGRLESFTQFFHQKSISGARFSYRIIAFSNFFRRRLQKSSLRKFNSLRNGIEFSRWKLFNFGYTRWTNEWMNECSPMFNLNVLWFFQALHQPASHKMRCLFFQSYLCGFPSLSRPMYLVSLMNQQEELRNEHESRLIKHTVLSQKNVSRVGKSLMHRCSGNFML